VAMVAVTADAPAAMTVQIRPYLGDEQRRGGAVDARSQETHRDAAGCLGAVAMRYAGDERQRTTYGSAWRERGRGRERERVGGMNPDGNEASGSGSGVPDRL
jgi:hypothetical protein